jgi:hypothetical protein
MIDKKQRIMKNILYFLILFLAVTSCDLNELPEDSATDE